MSRGQLWRDHMTPKEAEIVELVAEGKTNKAIAAELNLGEETIKFHLTNVMKKVLSQPRTRTGVARWWWEHVELGVPIPTRWEGSE